MAVAKPLLRFVGDTLELGKEGWTELEKARPPVRVVVVCGKGRCGKSWQLNQLTGTRAFHTSDSVEPATQGIDILVLHDQEGGDGSTVWLDVEGVQNALGKSRPKAGVLAQLLSTEIVSVGASMFDDTSIEMLGVQAALRRACQGSTFARPRLHHVVNLCNLKGFKQEELKRKLGEDRDVHRAILESFEPGSLIAIPYLTEGTSAEIESLITRLKAVLLSGCPAQIDGFQLSGADMAQIALAGIEQLKAMDEIDVSDTFHSILLRVCETHAQEATKVYDQTVATAESLTRFHESIDHLDEEGSLQPALAAFDSKTCHISEAVTQTVRMNLRQSLASAFQQTKARNESLAQSGTLRAQLHGQELLREYSEKLRRRSGPLSVNCEGHVDGAVEELMVNFWEKVAESTRPAELQRIGQQVSEGMDHLFRAWQKENKEKEQREQVLLQGWARTAVERLQTGSESMTYIDDLSALLDAKLRQCLLFFDNSAEGNARQTLVSEERQKLERRLQEAKSRALTANHALHEQGHKDLQHKAKDLKKVYRQRLQGLDFTKLTGFRSQEKESVLEDFDRYATGRCQRTSIRSLREWLVEALDEIFAEMYNWGLCEVQMERCNSDVAELLEQCRTGPLGTRHAMYQVWFEKASVTEEYVQAFLSSRVEPLEKAYAPFEALKDHVKAAVKRCSEEVFGADFVRRQRQAAANGLTTRRCVHCGIAYQKEGGCDHVRCGFLDWTGSMGEELQPPGRGCQGKVFGCGRAFDWGTAEDVTDAEWTIFFGWVRVPGFGGFVDSLQRGGRALGSALLSGLRFVFGSQAMVQETVDRELSILSQLQRTLAEERQALSPVDRARRWRQHILQWHPDKSEDPLATLVSQFLNQRKDWYLGRGD
ncbi:rha-1 [Symbiodinium sp. CCMP2456]|nr:rha-1 [Symbiodinium sp. CCMP2456]